MVRYRYPHIVSAWLPTELYIALEQYAKRTNKSKADVIREALKEYLERRGVNLDSLRRDFRKNPEKYQKTVVIL